MKLASKEILSDYQLKKLKYDFMGYTFRKINELSFHHLIIAHEFSEAWGLPREGYIKENGVLLVRDTAHDYLHVIQRIDDEIFLRITSEMIDELIKGKVDKENLIAIRDLLLYFEKEHIGDKNRKGKPIIKEDYLVKRLSL